MGFNLLATMFGVFTIFLGVKLLKKRIAKHRKIDTESIAVVKEVTDLGFDSLQKAYAIRYHVQTSSPFEILETPTKKKRAIGHERTVFFEEADPKNNFYFKSIGQLDNRFFAPIVMMIFGLIVLSSGVIGFVT